MESTYIDRVARMGAARVMQELSIQHTRGTARTGASLRLTLLNPATGEIEVAEGPFDFRLSPDEQKDLRWYLEQYASCPWGAYQDRARTAEASIRSIGIRLFRATFRSDGQQRLYGQIAGSLASTSIAICEQTSGDAGIPWELLHDPERPPGGSLSRAARRFFRTSSQPRLGREALVAGPLQVLLVICRPAGPEHDVPFQSVARPLVELFGREDVQGRIHLTVLDPPTFPHLARTLSERPGHFHIVHFDGHGYYPAIGEGYGDDVAGWLRQELEGHLIFEQEGPDRRTDQPITGEQFASAMVRGNVPIVVLNACQSAMADEASAVPSIAHQLLQAGAAGVVAMGYSLLIPSATMFMQRLYETLLADGDLGHAVRQARNALAEHPERKLSLAKVPVHDWMVPVLLQRGPVLLKSALATTPGPPADTASPARVRLEANCPPEPRHGLLGRDGVILELERAFRSSSVVWLKGMSGIGKTEVATGFARWLASTSRLDGAIVRIVVHPGAESAAVALQISGELSRLAIAPAAKAVERGGPTFEEVISHLRGHPHFVIIECAGVEAASAESLSDRVANHSAGLRPLIDGLLEGRTRVLVVSRRTEPEWLARRIPVIRLGGLRRPDATSLADRCISAAKPNEDGREDADGYQELLAQLGGNPRAILDVVSLAAASGMSAWTAGAPTSLLGDGWTALLDTADHFRKAGLADRFDDVMPFLSLFRDVVVADILGIISQHDAAPASMRDVPIPAWRDLLEILGQFGWCSETPLGYHELHPALSILARQWPSGPPRSQAAKRLFVRAVATVGFLLDEMYRQDTARAIALLQPLEANLRAALTHATSAHDWDNTPPLLTSIYRLYRNQPRWSEWARILSDAGEAALRSPGSDARDSALKMIRLFASELVRHGVPLEAHLAGLDASQATSLAGDIAMLFAAGNLALEQRRLDDAEQAFRQALQIAIADGEPLAASQVLLHLGIVGVLQGDRKTARSWLEQGLELAAGVPGASVQLLYQMAIVCLQDLDFPQAGRYLHECRSVATMLGNVSILANVELQLGILAFQQDLYDTAERHFQTSLTLAESSGDRRARAGAILQLAFIGLRLGRFDEAERWARQATAEAELLRDQDLASLAREALDDLEKVKRNPWYLAQLGADPHG
jgi:tetratricopeptide (TPR) repeat protein